MTDDERAVTAHTQTNSMKIPDMFGWNNTAKEAFTDWFQIYFSSPIEVRLDYHLHDIIRVDANWAKEYLESFPNHGIMFLWKESK